MYALNNFNQNKINYYFEKFEIEKFINNDI